MRIETFPGKLTTIAASLCRTACYLRYSSDMQRETSIEDQLRNIEDYCARMNLPKPIVFKDEAITGSRNDRPGYLTMLAAAKEGKFDILLVDDLYRLSRDQIETATTIRLLKYLDIRVLGVTDGIDTSREGYKLETTLRGLMGELFLDTLGKNVHRGQKGQALKGYSLGVLPFGYTSIDTGEGFKPVIDKEQVEWVRYIFERYANGVSTRKICLELNEKGVKGPRKGNRDSIWMHNTINPNPNMTGMLCNPIYIGKRIWNKANYKKDPITNKRKRSMRPREEWITIDSPELRIIDDALWEKCEARIKLQKTITDKQRNEGKKSGGAPSKYLFSGLLKCGVCGGKFIISNHKKYECFNHGINGSHACTNDLYVKRSTIEHDLLEGIKQELLSEEAYRDFEKNLHDFIKTDRADSTPIKKKISEHQKGIDNLIKAITNGLDSPSVKAALRDHEQQLQDAQIELRNFERFQPTQLASHAREKFEDLTVVLENIEDVETARQALQQLVGEIILKPENGTLTAEIASSGLSIALPITSNSGGRFERYLQPVRRFAGLK